MWIYKHLAWFHCPQNNGVGAILRWIIVFDVKHQQQPTTSFLRSGNYFNYYTITAQRLGLSTSRMDDRISFCLVRFHCYRFHVYHGLFILHAHYGKRSRDRPANISRRRITATESDRSANDGLTHCVYTHIVLYRKQYDLIKIIQNEFGSCKFFLCSLL